MDTEQLEAHRRQANAQLKRAKIGVDTAHSLVTQREAERAAAIAVVAQRKAQLSATETKLARSEQLAKNNTVSQQVLDDDRAAAQGARATVSAAEAQLAASEAAIESISADINDSTLVLSEKLEAQSKPQRTFEDLFELALWFLSNPWKLWSSGQYHLRPIVLRLAFSECVAHCRKSGFSNVKTALPFNVLRDVDGMKNVMARR